MRDSWKDHWLLNWRINRRLCIRFLPGPWLPAIYWQHEMRYFAIVLPLLGITFDYQPQE
jgi:hypothetical protein